MRLSHILIFPLLISFTHAQESIRFPSSGNLIDVTSYGAIPNDGIDDTVAIQQAITASIGQRFSLKTVYLPNGTYNISDTLRWLDSNGLYSAYLSLQGESESGVVLQLADNTFTNAGAPQAVLFTASNAGGGAPDPNGEGNTAFSNYIQNLTVDTGSGNPGAIGIDYLGNNAGAIRNVSIISGDGDGVAGIYLGRNWPGPWMLRDVTIDGFNYALDFDQQENYSTTADGLTIRNQQIAGIRNNKHVLSIRNLQSDNSLPALINGSHEALTSILDANLSGGDITASAISYRGSLYLRNISISGYQAQPIHSIERSVDEGNSFIDEYISHPVTSQFPSPARSMQLPIEEIPPTPVEPHDDWVVAGGFNSYYIQAAIDQANATGKKTVFLPAGQYNLNVPITISGSVERIYGFGAYLNWFLDDGASHTVFTIENTTTPALFFEHVTLSDPQVNNFIWFQDNSPTPIVFRDILMIGSGEFYANSVTDGSKKIFIENCAIARATFTGAKVWAWQLDPEDKTYKIINDGGQMWIFGYKCEWPNTNLINQNGARTEIIGGFFYPPFGSNSTNSGIGIINNESDLTAIFTYSGEYNEVLVRDIRGGITQDYTQTQSTADGHPRSGSTVPLYSSWESTIPNAPSNLNALANGSHAIDLSWTDNASSEIGFQLERRSGNENWILVSNAIPVNSTSYTDATVTPETNYEYHLRALGNLANSNLSNIASATTPSGVNPPGSLTVTTYGTINGTILLDPIQSEYTEGSTVMVTAVPAAGFMLERWSLDLNGNTNPTSILMDADKVIEASFVPDRSVPDVFENFDYASILTNQSGGDGWNGNWYNITGNDWKTDTVGLVHPNAIAPSGNAAYRQGGKAGRRLTAPRGNNDGSILYLSFLMKSAGLDSTGIYSAINLLNGGDADSFRQFEVGNLDDSGQFLAGNQSLSKTTQFGAIDTATHQVVMEFTFNPGTDNDVIKLWMDPSAYTDAYNTINGLDITFDRIVFNSWNQDITFDEVRMAGNWEAVTRATPAATPVLLGEDLLAYALGADSLATLPAALPDLQTASGQPFTCQVGNSSAEDIFYEVEISSDLSQWFRIARKPKYGIWSKDSASAYPDASSITVAPTVDGVDITHEGFVDRYFLRLRISQ